jgi:hypothetical protein
MPMLLTLNDQIAASTPCKCDNCGHKTTARQLNPIEDAHLRLTPGGVVPAGECPACGCFAYIETDPWLDNAIQYPRLIAEAQGAGAFTPGAGCVVLMAHEMDLPVVRVRELIDRACDEWDSIKATL